MRSKILSILKNADDYVSGEDISRKLGISRAAVWKHIKKLKSDGYEIISVTNKGYKLAAVPDAISKNVIGLSLNTEVIARNIIYTEETDSTNEDAKRHSSEAHGTLFISELQNAGKGRLGRSWESPKGSGICMSLLLKPDILPQDISQITLIAGIAVCRAVGHGAKIKWPNDIVLGARKVCGILTEMSAEINRVNYVVCGIGINVNTSGFPKELEDRACSIFTETGARTPRNELIASVMNEFEPLYESFINNGFASAADEYRRLCLTLGKDVRVISHKETVTGTAVDIDNEGGLIVRTSAGTMSISSGEVSVRGIYGYV